MSGGFFRGTSADQDTRFSNKTAKLLKTQKFAPELDQLIDMSKIKMDTLRPWIATRVTQFLGFEDEVLINFIYELLEGKNVDGKQIQIQLTGFMEKNTGKFMKELWGLLTSAQNTASGIPQQLLDEKAEEARQKKAEEHRIISEVRRKEDEKRTLEQEVAKKEVALVEVQKDVSSLVPKASSNSLTRGGKSPDDNRRNGTMDSRRPASRSQSGSGRSSRSVSRSPHPTSKRRLSHSASLSPPRRSRRSRSLPRHGRSPYYVRRSRSPLRRAWSPNNTRSPRRRRRSYSRSPRGRSPVAAARSPRRRRSPQMSYSPRGRSPNLRSPRRRRSPVFNRSSPRRRKSPARSPRYRRRSPRYAVHRNTSPPARHRHTALSPQHHTNSSPRQRHHFSSPRRGSPPRRMMRSSSPIALSKSPQHGGSSGSPQRHLSTSPSSTRKSSPSHRNISTVASPQQRIPSSLKGRLSKGPMSPIQQQKLPAYQQDSSRSPSPVVVTEKPVLKSAESPSRRTHREAPVQHRRLSPSMSPQTRPRSPSLSQASPPKEKWHSRSPLASGRDFVRDGPVKTEQCNQKTSERMSVNTVIKKRTRASSRESSLPDEDMDGAPLKKAGISDVNAGALSIVNSQAGRGDEAIGSVSKSSDDDQHLSPGTKRRISRDVESDGNEDHGAASPVGLDDRKAAKRRRKEERRLRKEEKRRKREERHRRKEEKRANKFSSKGITSVTPPPDFNKRPLRSGEFDTVDEGKGEEEDMEIEQIKLENELRRKALDSIRAKKVVSS